MKFLYLDITFGTVDLPQILSKQRYNTLYNHIFNPTTLRYLMLMLKTIPTEPTIQPQNRIISILTIKFKILDSLQFLPDQSEYVIGQIICVLFIAEFYAAAICGLIMIDL